MDNKQQLQNLLLTIQKAKDWVKNYINFERTHLPVVFSEYVEHGSFVTVRRSEFASALLLLSQLVGPGESETGSSSTSTITLSSLWDYYTRFYNGSASNFTHMLLVHILWFNRYDGVMCGPFIDKLFTKYTSEITTYILQKRFFDIGKLFSRSIGISAHMAAIVNGTIITGNDMTRTTKKRTIPKYSELWIRIMTSDDNQWSCCNERLKNFRGGCVKGKLLALACYEDGNVHLRVFSVDSLRITPRQTTSDHADTNIIYFDLPTPLINVTSHGHISKEDPLIMNMSDDYVGFQCGTTLTIYQIGSGSLGGATVLRGVRVTAFAFCDKRILLGVEQQLDVYDLVTSNAIQSSSSSSVPLKQCDGPLCFKKVQRWNPYGLYVRDNTSATISQMFDLYSTLDIGVDPSRFNLMAKMSFTLYSEFGKLSRKMLTAWVDLARREIKLGPAMGPYLRQLLALAQPLSRAWVIAVQRASPLMIKIQEEESDVEKGGSTLFAKPNATSNSPPLQKTPSTTSSTSATPSEETILNTMEFPQIDLLFARLEKMVSGTDDTSVKELKDVHERLKKAATSVQTEKNHARAHAEILGTFSMICGLNGVGHPDLSVYVTPTTRAESEDITFIYSQAPGRVVLGTANNIILASIDEYSEKTVMFRQYKAIDRTKLDSSMRDTVVSTIVSAAAYGDVLAIMGCGSTLNVYDGRRLLSYGDFRGNIKNVPLTIDPLCQNCVAFMDNGMSVAILYQLGFVTVCTFKPAVIKSSITEVQPPKINPATTTPAAVKTPTPETVLPATVTETPVVSAQKKQ